MFKDKELIAQFGRFSAVGIISFLTDYGFMIWLTETSTMGYFFSCAFSYTFSITVNYLLSMRFVFHGRDDVSKVREASTFFTLSLIGLLINLVIMWVAVDVLHIYYAAAKVISALMVTSYNFVSRKAFIE